MFKYYHVPQIVGIKDVVLPPQRDAFEDVYIAYELMDTDLHKVINSNPELTENHHQVLFFLSKTYKSYV